MYQETRALIDNNTISHVLLSTHRDRPIPYVRIYTCGGLRIEILQREGNAVEQAQYGPPSSSSLSGRGAIPAQMLLKHLISAPDHYRSIDWLQEHWYARDEDRTALRFDSKVSYLRTLLCPSYLHNEQCTLYRRQLVSYISSTGGSGNGYLLGAYPLIWIDIDAIDWNVRQACRLERYGDDARPFGERAYQLAAQGTYLPEETYSDWAEPRRLAVTRSLRLCVHALMNLYRRQYEEKGQPEVIRMLQSYLLQFPDDEDALCVLLKILGQQQRFQEAEQFYLRTKSVVERKGNALTAHTGDVHEYLQTKQYYRQ
jgi:DNA-binding transcriptional activator of the SARP family